MHSLPIDSQVYLDRQRIAERVALLGDAIGRAYPDGELLLLCVLKGSFVFFADLARAISRPALIEFLGVQSYGSGTESSGAVRITHDLARPVTGQHVLLVEDIVDTGLTARYLLEQVRSRGALSVRLCALLHKPSREKVSVHIDFAGFTIEDRFVVGYGLDLDQQYRNLPDIHALPSRGTPKASFPTVPTAQGAGPAPGRDS